MQKVKKNDGVNNQNTTMALVKSLYIITSSLWVYLLLK